MKNRDPLVETYTQNGISYKAVGFYLLIELDALPASKSAIVIPGEDEKREQYLQARTRGIVRAIGSMAYDDESNDRCAVGDVVSFRGYTGTDANRTIDGRLPKDEPILRWVIDKEIMGVITPIKEETGEK